MAKKGVVGDRATSMRPLVEEWRRGTASQAEVARRYGLYAGTLSWWCSRFGGRRGRSKSQGLCGRGRAVGGVVRGGGRGLRSRALRRPLCPGPGVLPAIGDSDLEVLGQAAVGALDRAS